MRKILLSLLLCLITGISAFANEGLTNPKVKWKFKTQGPIRGSAVIADEHIYFGSSDGFLYALKEKDGHLLWKFQTGGVIAGAPAVSGNQVYVAGRNDFVYALDARTGEIRWKFQMQPILTEDTEWEYFTAAPVVVGDAVLIGSGDGHLYALDCTQGKLLWKFRTNGRIRASSLVVDNVIYQPSGDDYVYALAVDDGSLLWKFETEGASLERGSGFSRNNIFTKPSLKDDLLVFGSRDSNVYAVNTKTHEKKWNFTLNGSTWAMTTIIDEDVVYAGWSAKGIFCALDLHSGKEKWRFKCGAHTYSTPLIVGTTVCFGSANGKLYSLDKETGEMNWEYNIGSTVHSAPVYNSGTLFVGSDDGFFYALEEGANAYKSVYAPTVLEGRYKRMIVDAKIAPYLVDQGFEHIESASLLSQFISDRIDDGAPSVVVFALSYIPQDIIGKNPGEGMMRKYLESGGKVIWLGYIPNLAVLTEQGVFIKRDPSIATQLLDTEFIRIRDAGDYFSKSTQEGLNWGLPSWLKNTSYHPNVKLSDGVIPLSIDEFGRVGAWMKKFNPRPGSAYVSFRSWSFFLPIRDEDLKLIYQLAVHELE